MRIGSRGYEVSQLQKRLDITADGIFGPITEKAVKNFQASVGTTADGIVGPATRAFLNKGEGKPTLEEWAKAIQQFEGYYPGSLSYRNKNPGNLRRGKGQIGVYKNFAIFETYEDGFEALLHQLRLSATSTGPNYHHSMTLLEFFEVYAPEADSNQPNGYAAFVAQKLRVGINYPIANFLQ